MEPISGAIQYVRENKTWTNHQEALAIEDMVRYRCPIEYADDDISDEIAALMDEYGKELGLPDGWWMEHEVNEIFWEL